MEELLNVLRKILQTNETINRKYVIEAWRECGYSEPSPLQINNILKKIEKDKWIRREDGGQFRSLLFIEIEDPIERERSRRKNMLWKMSLCLH